MTSNDRQTEDREALTRLLDIYGADRTRWPARERLRFAGLVVEDKMAAQILGEAEALDRLLDQAPRVAHAKIDALKERIIAAALRSDRPQLRAVAGSKAEPAKAWFGPMRRAGRSASFSEWPAAAVLAASLVLGVALGSAGTVHNTMREVASVAGISSASEGTDLALGDDILGNENEDLL